MAFVVCGLFAGAISVAIFNPEPDHDPMVRHRQPPLESVLRWPFRQRSRKSFRPQWRHLLLRPRLLTLTPNLLLQPPCRRSLPKSRDREFGTRWTSAGRASATIIPTHRATARVARVTACPIHMFRADTLASGKFSFLVRKTLYFANGSEGRPSMTRIGFRRERAHCGASSERERIRQVLANGTRSQSCRCASSYSIS
jgi:hypothetical protein